MLLFNFPDPTKSLEKRRKFQTASHREASGSQLQLREEPGEVGLEHVDASFCACLCRTIGL